jgi:hypothetical protein
MNGLESKSYTFKKKKTKFNPYEKKNRINPVFAVKLAI